MTCLHARDGDGVLLTVRTSKTNQEGDAADVRYLKNGVAKAIRTVRAVSSDADTTYRVNGLSPLQVQRRFTVGRTWRVAGGALSHGGRRRTCISPSPPLASRRRDCKES